MSDGNGVSGAGADVEAFDVELVSAAVVDVVTAAAAAAAAPDVVSAASDAVAVSIGDALSTCMFLRRFLMNSSFVWQEECPVG